MQKIPFSAAQSEFTEKRSRFIGQVWPVSSEEEACIVSSVSSSIMPFIRVTCPAEMFSAGTPLSASNEISSGDSESEPLGISFM